MGEEDGEHLSKFQTASFNQSFPHSVHFLGAFAKAK